MTKKLLLINDLASYGKVALGAMMPVLTRMGYDLYTLPTALVSNTLDYERFELLDTTDFMERTLETWADLGFSFDALCVGMVVNERQAQLIGSFCAAQQAHGVPVFVDPIMGDNGRLYNGMSRTAATYLRPLLACADVAVPSYTEACLLTGAPYSGCQGMSDHDVMRLMTCLRGMCPKSVVVTSAVVDGSAAVLGYDHERDEDFVIPFEEVPVRYPGTGDVFTAVLMGKKLAGYTLEDATASAMHVVKDLVRKYRSEAGQDEADAFKGIPLERYLSNLPR